MESEFAAAIRELMEAIGNFQKAANEELQRECAKPNPSPRAKAWVARAKTATTELEIALLTR